MFSTHEMKYIRYLLKKVNFLFILYFFVFCLFVFLLVLNLFCSFYRVCQMVISKKTIIFQGFRGGQHLPGGTTFSRGGGGGVQMLISIETHITCDFPGGSRPLIPPLDPHTQLVIHSPENTNKITDVWVLTCTTFHFIFNFYCFFI